MRRFNSKKPDNNQILANLMSKLRRIKLPSEINYIILYTFFYKYCSDNLKDYFSSLLKDKELTLDEAYKSKIYREDFKLDSLNLFGYYIDKPDAFMDDILNKDLTDEKFLSEFITVFPKSVMFNEEFHNSKYFDFLFNTVSEMIHKGKYKFESENYAAIKEIITLISKFDIYEEKLSFVNAFDIISNSRLMSIDSNPDYISQILTCLIYCQKESVINAYDPFMKNGNTLMDLSAFYGFDLKNVFGKEIDKLNYSFAIVKFFISNFSFNNLFFKQEDAVESVDINGTSFDAILSNIPIAIKNYPSTNKTQSLEMAKRNKRNELEEILLKNFDMDSESFTHDLALNNALENLVDKMDFENDSNLGFTGEYESLKDSEFLFLINLIDSLKDDGIMAISISQNFLFKDSLETLRKYLTDKCNYIDAVINIPHEIDRYKRPEVVIVFRKNKIKKDILFIDMSNDYETQRNNLIFPGLFRKNLILDNKTINKMADVISNKLTIPKYSELISIDEIIENNFNLSVYRYVDTFEGEFVKLSELVSEKKEIDANIEKLNSKIGKMMDDLNIRF